jgi:hypothetical protein
LLLLLCVTFAPKLTYCSVSVLHSQMGILANFP